MAYATVEELEKRYRVLDGAERERAALLLDDASVLIGSLIGETDVPLQLLKAVTCSMVKRALSAPVGAPISSIAQSAGTYSETLQFQNPAGDLYLTASERRALKIRRARIGSIAPLIGRDHDDR